MVISSSPDWVPDQGRGKDVEMLMYLSFSWIQSFFREFFPLSTWEAKFQIAASAYTSVYSVARP